MEKRAERWPHQEKPTLVSTTCSKCPVGCEIDLNLDTSCERIVRVTSDFNKIDSPSFGMTCVKGRYQFGDVAEHRLMSPMAKGAEIGWADARGEGLSHDEERLKGGLRPRSGPDQRGDELSIGLHSPRQGLRLTWRSKAWPALLPLPRRWRQAWGRRSTGIGYDALIDSDCILLLDDNLSDDQPVMSSWIRRAMRKNGATMVYAGDHSDKFDMGDAIVIGCDVASASRGDPQPHQGRGKKLLL